MERLRGREQLLVRPGPGFPLLLLTYPKGSEADAADVETIFAHGLPRLPQRLLEPYADMLSKLPTMVVVLLRPRNTCGCLGHYHPRGTESRLARRLASELGSDVGEIDLAYQSIRQWEPHPISSRATGDLGGLLPSLHFEAALLGVFLHELEHLAHPNREEREIRSASDEFYSQLMEELVSRETGGSYGMTRRPPS